MTEYNGLSTAVFYFRKLPASSFYYFRKKKGVGYELLRNISPHIINLLNFCTGKCNTRWTCVKYRICEGNKVADCFCKTSPHDIMFFTE
jgi:hypothetical protein